jgi:broad specificity phosphatase PhoE
MIPIYSDPKNLPESLLIVRHGESAGNVAREEAIRSGALNIEIEGRDVDVPLSKLGEAQSLALGQYLATSDRRADVILSSPYRRSQDTARILMDADAVADDFDRILLDERLREKEFGIVDGLTRQGIEKHYPDQARFRSVIGKFYHRPPGGESWCDVILRLRSMFDTLSLHYAGKRVLIVTHQVVVLCFRYLLEGLDEERILAIDREGDVANCAITEYRLEGKRGLVLQRYNHVTPVAQKTAVTAAPDKKASGA